MFRTSDTRWKVRVQTCLPPNCRQHLLVGKVVVLNCPANLLAQPQRRIVSSIVIGTKPSFRCTSLFGICNIVGSLSQFLTVIARSRLASLFWHASCERSSFSVTLPFCPAIAHKPERSACLEAVALVLEIYLRFQELIHFVPRIPGCGKSRFPLRGEGHITSQSASQIPYLRL